MAAAALEPGSALMTGYWLADAAVTDCLGQALARTLPSHAVVHLRGELGAGKSTLARALLRALGVQGAIRSPTYTLIERYPLAGGGEAWHLDLYRIADAAELEYLGLDSSEARLWLVEWPERGRGGLPAEDLVVTLEVQGSGRRVELAAASAVGEAWLAQLDLQGAVAGHGLAGDS